MLKRSLIAWILFLGFTVYLIYSQLTDIDEGTQYGYEVFKNGLQKMVAKNSESSQRKENVQKELFTLGGESPLHARLKAKRSRLFLSRKEESEEVAEAMEEVALYAQESLSENEQMIRVILAKKATYFIKEDRLTLTDVNLYRFKIKGVTLPEDFPEEIPLMQGDASWAELFIKGNKIDLDASNVTLYETENEAFVSADSLLFDGTFAFFAGNVVLEGKMGKATAEEGELLYEKGAGKHGIKEAILNRDVHFYHPDGSFLTCDNARIHMDAQKLYCLGPAALTRIDPIKESSHTLYAPGGIEVDHNLKKSVFLRDANSQIHFIDSFGEIYADEGEADYEGKVLKGLKMVGKVFMAHALPQEDDRSYAYADKVTYDPETKEMVLEGDRVLVYDRVNKMEVSAPRLRVKRDEKTQKDKIKGEGDIRFKLDEKEFEMLKNRFKWQDPNT